MFGFSFERWSYPVAGKPDHHVTREDLPSSALLGRHRPASVGQPSSTSSSTKMEKGCCGWGFYVWDLRVTRLVSYFPSPQQEQLNTRPFFFCREVNSLWRLKSSQPWIPGLLSDRCARGGIRGALEPAGPREQEPVHQRAVTATPSARRSAGHRRECMTLSPLLYLTQQNTDVLQIDPSDSGRGRRSCLIRRMDMTGADTSKKIRTVEFHTKLLFLVRAKMNRIHYLMLCLLQAG